MKNISKTGLFLIILFLLSYSAAGIYRLAGGGGPGSSAYIIFGVFYMFIPTITVLIVRKLVWREEIRHDLMISLKLNVWLIVSWLLIPVMVFATVGINILFPGAAYSPEMTGFFERLGSQMTAEQMEQMRESMDKLPMGVLWLTLSQGMVAGITINAVAAFGEELGWRGFLLKAFRHMNFVRASVLIGIIWGIWHAPMILMGHNYPEHPHLGVLMMTVFCVLFSPFLMYVTIKSRSVISAAIMHGTLNGVAGISIMLVEGGNDLVKGFTGLAGFATMSVFLLLLFVYDMYISKNRIFANSIADYV